jgi:hypothetical protein
LAQLLTFTTHTVVIVVRWSRRILAIDAVPCLGLPCGIEARSRPVEVLNRRVAALDRMRVQLPRNSALSVNDNVLLDARAWLHLEGG